MKLTPHLNFEGRCEEAIAFYEKALGAKVINKTTYAQTPMASKMKPDWGKKIIHAEFEVFGQKVGAADPPPEYYQKPQGFALTLEAATPEEAEKAFTALSDGAKVTMPIQETFWAQRFGSLIDKFGIGWMVNCSKTN